MYERFATTSYEKFAQELNEATAWLQSLGIDYMRTRIGEYQKAISVLIEMYKNEDIERQKKEFVRIANAIFEAHDCIAIHKSLAGKYDNEIEEHIRLFSGGPVQYRQEGTSASNRARNIAFELVVAARLVDVKIPLDFRIRTDIAGRFDNRSILLECKRPQSNKKIEANVKDAFKQLERKYQNPIRTRYRGIIAIDISKLINPKFQLYIQQTEHDIESGLSGIVDDFIRSNERYWQLDRNSKTIGVLIRLGVMGIIKEKNDLLTYCQQYGLTPINNSGHRNIQTAKALAQTL